jgi:hypothetical protein
MRSESAFVFVEVVEQRYLDVTAQHWDRLPKNQPAEITMFQISEV